MAEFFYININFEEEKPFVDHMNKIPYRLYVDPEELFFDRLRAELFEAAKKTFCSYVDNKNRTAAAKQAAEKLGTGQERRSSGAKARLILNQIYGRTKVVP
jgi:hypothetical protein